MQLQADLEAANEATERAEREKRALEVIKLSNYDLRTSNNLSPLDRS